MEGWQRLEGSPSPTTNQGTDWECSKGRQGQRKGFRDVPSCGTSIYSPLLLCAFIPQRAISTKSMWRTAALPLFYISIIDSPRCYQNRIYQKTCNLMEYNLLACVLQKLLNWHVLFSCVHVFVCICVSVCAFTFTWDWWCH